MVDFKLTPEQFAIQKSVREFAEKEIKPIAMERDQMADHEAIFPAEQFKKSFDIGIHDATIPKQYGGQGLDCLTHVLIWEELAAADAGFCVSYQGHFLALEHICGPRATEQQRETFLRPLAEKGGLAAYALTEPNVGPCWLLVQEDFIQETTLERDGDDYILNGVKNFCTNGGSPLTKWYVIWARGDQEKVGLEACRTCFVWADSPGLTAPRSEDKMGQRLSKNAQLYLNNVRVPKEHVIGEPGGMVPELNAQQRLITANSWILLGALCVGIARTAYEEALAYAKKRVIAGKPAIQHQLIGAKLADMFWHIEAVRAYVWKAADYFDKNPAVDMKLAQGAKVIASDLAVKTADEALQIHGGYGYTKNSLVEKLYRDAKVTQIYECPNELLRVTTASMLAFGM
ncbi:MAG: acyl-CoA dehydrogenase family protein [Desulfobacterales bacterium]